MIVGLVKRQKTVDTLCSFGRIVIGLICWSLSPLLVRPLLLSILCVIHLYWCTDHSTITENPQVIEIAQGLHGHASWLSVLKSPANAIDGKRVIVAWSGEDLFRCSSCKRSSLEHPPACLHRQRARDYLVNALGRAVGVQAVNAEQFPPRQIGKSI